MTDTPTLFPGMTQKDIDQYEKYLKEEEEKERIQLEKEKDAFFAFYFIMKDTIIILICTLPSIALALAVGEILAAMNGVSGWGWFLVAAILTNPAVAGLSVND